TPSGVTTTYPLPDVTDHMASDAAGTLWVQDSDGSIAKFDASGPAGEFPLPAGNTYGPETRGPDGAVWFTSGPTPGSGSAPATAHIARISDEGAITSIALAASVPMPAAMTLGPDGNFWA